MSGEEEVGTETGGLGVGDGRSEYWERHLESGEPLCDELGALCNRNCKESTRMVLAKTPHHSGFRD